MLMMKKIMSIVMMLMTITMMMEMMLLMYDKSQKRQYLTMTLASSHGVHG